MGAGQAIAGPLELHPQPFFFTFPLFLVEFIYYSFVLFECVHACVEQKAIVRVSSLLPLCGFQVIRLGSKHPLTEP